MIEKRILASGARLMLEHFPHVRSVSFGFYVGSGSRHEPERLSGVSHALEHMIFKGTPTRSAADIAAEMDFIGGHVNAFTTKEATCFYGRALDSHLPRALALMTDIFFNSRLDEEDWQTERGVILEEIGMYEDSPEDLVSERLYGHVYQNHPLGRAILGTPETLTAMTADDLRAHYAAHYRPEHIVVSLAGHYSDEHVAFLENAFGALPRRDVGDSVTPPLYHPGLTVREKPIEQNHLCLGFPCPAYGDERRQVLQVLSGILGAGMSSRLFQTVREQRGLCYSIYSFAATQCDAGLFGVYTALGRETERQALELTRDVLRRFIEDGPAPDEVERVREQIKANILLGLESTSSRMSHMGQNELLLGRVPSPDEIIERFDAVTAERVHALAREILDFDRMSFSAVGQVDSAEAYHALLAGVGV